MADRTPLLPSDPLFIQDDLGYSPEVLSDMQAADVTQGIGSLNTPNVDVDYLRLLLEGAKAIPSTVYDYATTTSPKEFVEDVGQFGSMMVEGIKEEPVSFLAETFIPPYGAYVGARDAKTMLEQAAEAEATGDTEAAKRFKQLAALSASSVIPGVRAPGFDIPPVMGMAARPKGAFMRPTSTYNPPDPADLSPGDPDIKNPITERYGGAPSNIREYERSLEINLIDQGVDEDVAFTVAEKAAKYFMKEFGTADDRLRQGLLKGDIEPEFYDLGETPFPPALAQQTQFFSNLEKARQGDPAAREIFEKDYDLATGLQRTIVDSVTGDIDDPLPAQISEAQKMLDEGVPESLILNAYGKQRTGPVGFNPARRPYQNLYLDADIKTPDEFLKNFGPAFKRYSPESTADLRDLTFEPTSYLRDTAPELIRAMDQGDMIYELEDNMLQPISEGLDFLTPHKLAAELSNLPTKQLEKASFPDLVMQGKKAVPTPNTKQKKAALELSKEDARRESRKENAQTPDERNAAVPTELKTKVGVTSYLTPNNDRTWYSLDTDAALQLEGGLMRHSIGGYAKNGNYSEAKRQAYADGDIKVFSLREKDGQPRITVAINVKDKTRPFVLDAYGYQNSFIPMRDLKDLFDLFSELKIEPRAANVEGVSGGQTLRGSGEQYDVYLQTGDIFTLDEAKSFLGREGPEVFEVPDLPEDFNEGGIVSLANGGAVEHGVVTL